ncbi:MAG: Maf family protein [Halanaerobiales bacterium]|nr:Maf family protein [Halanaerobiales bacterium]
MSKIILASNSPRREKLLKQLGLSFTIVPSKIDEKSYADLEPEVMVQELAGAKAQEVAELVEETVVIGADTIVLAEQHILGKPRDQEEAFQMLWRLQGKKHRVLTGLAVYDTKSGRLLVDYDRAEVYLRKMEEREITAYIGTGEPMDKAGAYAIQGLGGIFVEGLVGSYYTVVGLPIHKLVLMLKEFQIKVL